MDRNVENILSLLAKNPAARVVDVGCGDGKLTVRFKQQVRCQKILGIDGQHDRLKAAKDLGFKVVAQARPHTIAGLVEAILRWRRA